MAAYRAVGSLWRRFVAYALDALVLGVVGSGIGAVFFDRLAQLGPWGRLVGFSVSFVYFGVLDSNIGNGQTLGKRWLRLRVIDRSGSPISLARSLLRTLIFVIPPSLYGLKLAESRTPSIVISLVFMVVWWVGGATLYLVAFNQRTRQGIHDIVVGSCVANAEVFGPLRIERAQKAIWVVLSIILAVYTTSVQIVKTKDEEAPPYPQLRQDEREIEALNGVWRARLRDRLQHSSGGESVKKNLVATVTLSTPKDAETFASEVAAAILQKDASAHYYDQLTVQIYYGYDIGIAQRWNHQEFSRTPLEWGSGH